MFNHYVWGSHELREALSYEYAKKFIEYFGRDPTIEEQLNFYKLLKPQKPTGG